jgi:hypothetical protein
VFIGHDDREQRAFDAAAASLQRIKPQVVPTALRADRLAACGLLRRPVDRRAGRYDLVSNAPQATDFAISRFLVPMLAQEGPALFVDCDVVFLADVAELFALFDPSKAVQVVQHPPLLSEVEKMDGQAQIRYPRKNWSSVMLFNCDHPANRRLTLQDVNERPGRDLHAFYWLHDSEIGALPPEWNWLVGVQPKPTRPKLAHFTLGGPFLQGWPGAEHDEIWHGALK